MADTSGSSERPKLKLLPKGASATALPPAAASPESAQKKSNPFGEAKPRELNVKPEKESHLQEKYSEIDTERELSISARKEQAEQARQKIIAEGGNPDAVEPRQHHHHQQHHHHHQDQQPRREGGGWGDSNSPSRGGQRGHFGGSGHQGGHQHRPFQQHDGPRQPPPENYTCKICNIPGHWIHECEQYQGRSQQRDGGEQFHRKPAPYNDGFTVVGARGGHGSPAGGDRRRFDDRAGGDRSRGDGSGYDQSTRRFDQPRTRPQGGIPPSGYVCNICQIQGHFKQDCPDNTRPPSDGHHVRGSVPRPGYVCKICNIPGHYVQDCEQKS